MIRKLFPKPVRRPLALLRDGLVASLLARRARLRSNRPNLAIPHSLKGELIVSLTSYPARFGTLHLTLACLLDQTVKADRTILWVAEEDVQFLPPQVRNLEARGLEIRACDDLRSYKKLVPAIKAFPDAFIATADDDAYYPSDWLDQLVQGLEGSAVVTCHRAHRICRSPNGSIAPYLNWELNVRDERARRPSSDLLPTGAGGILYPPASLDSRVMEETLFERLCPDGDDLWFYWCARARGTCHKKVGPKFRLTVWRQTQASSLWSTNEAGGNDLMIAALQRELPLTS